MGKSRNSGRCIPQPPQGALGSRGPAPRTPGYTRCSLRITQPLQFPEEGPTLGTFDFPDFYRFLPISRTFLGELRPRQNSTPRRFASFTGRFTCNHLGLFARLITSFSMSSMVLLQHARVFFSRFLESRNYKIRRQVHVGRRSVVVLSGVMEAPYSHFFIGRGFNCFDCWNLSR